jgi:hypothetical protein
VEEINNALKELEERLSESLGAAPTLCAKQTNTAENINTLRKKHDKNKQNKKGKTTKHNRIKPKPKRRIHSKR